jgi:hypothetical protein
MTTELSIKIKAANCTSFRVVRQPLRQQSAPHYPEVTVGAAVIQLHPTTGSRIELISDLKRILALHPLLVQIGALAGESHDVEDLHYLLSTAELSKKRPRLLLLPAEGDEPAVTGFTAAVLLFEYSIPVGLGWSFGRSGIYASIDLTGRRVVFARRTVRARVAARAARFLIEYGHAHIVHIVFSQMPDDPQAEIAIREVGDTQQPMQRGGFWSLKETRNKEYLSLGPTFSATLARVGPHTRWNLRYYRRRTERDLGCTYIPNAQVGLDEFVAFNKECSHATADPQKRYENLKALKRPLFAGIQDREGRWLALVGGRRRTREVEIDWQMNRHNVPLYSISTVLRSSLIEHEVGLGTTRLYIAGGTRQHIGNYFVEENLCELTVRRRSRSAALLIWLIRRFQPQKNPLAKIVSDPRQIWHGW